MPNPARGEVSLRVGEASLTLVLDIEQLCEVEAALGLDIVQVLGRLRYFTTARVVLWAALRRYHPALSGMAVGGPDMGEIGRMVRSVGLGGVLNIAGRVMAASFPEVSAASVKAARTASREGGETGWDWGKLYARWCGLGFPPEQFWRQTPRLLMLAQNGRDQAEQERRKQRRAEIWLLSYLPKAKRPPNFKRFVEGQAAEARKQTAAEISSGIRAWAASYKAGKAKAEKTKAEADASAARARASAARRAKTRARLRAAKPPS